MILVFQPLFLTLHNVDGNGDNDLFVPLQRNEAKQVDGGEL